MIKRIATPVVCIVALVSVTAAAIAQQSVRGMSSYGAGRAAPTHAQPYAGQQSREATSLSAEEIEGLRAGHGMGLARPAELNGYPGPMHVLEIAADLELTDDQRVKIEDSFNRMKGRAQAAGAAYVAAEKAIDDAFRAGADRETIAGLVREADLKRAEKRLAHLDAHLEVTPLLTPEQRRKYAELRGYK